MTKYNFGDIIIINFPHTDLQGSSKRPALVLYDAGDNDVAVARITSQEYITPSDYRIAQWERSGLLLESYIRLGKLITIEKQYISRQLGRIEETEINSVKAILKSMFSL